MLGANVQTKREIADRLAAAGLRPRKRLGQHFLIDGNLMRGIVDAAELTSADCALEIGGGTGGLTDLLAARARQVICVELDGDLFVMLQDRFRDTPRVTLIRGDILESKGRLSPAVMDVVGQHASVGDVKLVANLPYQVATPFVMNLLLDHPEVTRLVFTVQAEVGQRIMAGPNTKAYGPVSILSQLLCKVHMVSRLGPDAFWPRPAVDSVMLRMDVGESPFEDRAHLAGFASFVRAAFGHRRKTLRKALSYVLEPEACDAVCRGVDATRRAESFAISEWLEIHALVRADRGT